jgi:hypothetical protein
MPYRSLLETYPLYRRLKVAVPTSVKELPVTAINMACGECRSDQTFVMVSSFADGLPHGPFEPAAGLVLRAVYVCMSCRSFHREFLLEIDESGRWIMKVGQFPAWDIEGDSNVERPLGDHAPYFKRGLICESQGFGIAAFAYYRRIVEEVIDQLLDQIRDLLADDEAEKYSAALAATRKTTVAAEKIEFVKDLLPPILRPNGINPLAVLHSLLSKGLHTESDEQCIESAASVREVLVFLAAQVAAARESGRNFTDRMRKLLERKQ